LKGLCSEELHKTSGQWCDARSKALETPLAGMTQWRLEDRRNVEGAPEKDTLYRCQKKDTRYIAVPRLTSTDVPSCPRARPSDSGRTPPTGGVARDGAERHRRYVLNSTSTHSTWRAAGATRRPTRRRGGARIAGCRRSVLVTGDHYQVTDSPAKEGRAPAAQRRPRSTT